MMIRPRFLSIAVATFLCFVQVPSAGAFPQFHKQFLAVYATGPESEEYAALVKTKVKCFVCHGTKKDEDGKTSKKVRNAYGKELAKLLDKADKKDVEKIRQALATVARIQVDSSVPDSPTYGDRIKNRRLPVDVVLED